MQLLAFFRKSPFFRIFLLYTTGLIVAFHLENNQIIFLTSFVFAFISLLILFSISLWFDRHYKNLVYGLFVSVCFLALAILNVNLQSVREQKVLDNAGVVGSFRLRILEPADTTMKLIRTTADVLEMKSDTVFKKANFKILLFIDKDFTPSSINPGAELLIQTKLSPIQPPLNPGEFNYKRFLGNRGIWLQAYLKKGQGEILKTDNRIHLGILAIKLREQLLNKYRSIGLSRNEFGLLSAITLGFKNDVDAETKAAFSKAGVMHVMALSGFNVGIIAIVLGFLLGIFDFHTSGRIFKTIVIIVTIWLFAFITGFSASVVRATVMLTFVLTGKILNKHVNTYNILFASAFLMITFYPTQLTDVGFQLSFAAVLGIVFFHPMLYRILAFRNFFVDKLWQLFTVSCAAQLATLPISLYYFHQFPLYFWLTNLYVVPLVTIITCMACAFLLLSFIKPVAFILGKALMILIKGLIISVSLVEHLPHALIDGVYISMPQVFLLLAFFIIIGLFILHKNRLMVFAGLSIIVLFLTCSLNHTINVRRQHLFTINAVKGATAINLINKSENLLLYSSDSLITNNLISYSFRNNWIYHNVWKDHQLESIDTPGFTSVKFPDLMLSHNLMNSGLYFKYFDRDVVYLRNNNFSHFITSTPLKIDALVVSKNVRPDLKTILNYFNIKILVIDSSNDYFNRNKWKAQCVKFGINYWAVSDMGAFRIL